MTILMHQKDEKAMRSTLENLSMPAGLRWQGLTIPSFFGALH